MLFLRQSYTLDLRSLAVLRIGIGLVVLADLFIRSADLNAHYADDGTWPSTIIRNLGWKHGYWTLHDLFHTQNWLIFLFTLHFLSAAFLTLGFFTRISTILLFFLTISLHNRHIFILQGGDDLLRMVLFWGIFLPWQQFYSLDHNRKKTFSQGPFFAHLGYVILIASVYLFSAALKTSSEWRGDFEAVYYALSLEQLRLIPGDLIYKYPSLLKVITALVLIAELLIPILLLWPSRKKILRTAGVILIFLLHAGIGMTLYVGLFYLIGMVSAIGLLPGSVFEKLETRFSYPGESLNVHKNKIILRLQNIICITAIIICIIVNLSGLNWFTYKLAPPLEKTAHFLRFDQFWGMFSPGVLKKDGWFVYHGMDSIGRQWDLRLNQDHVDYKKPQRIVSMYASDRWRKLAENMQDERFTFLRPLYCKHVLKEWNKKHPEKKILTLNLYFMSKENLPGYKTTAYTKNLYSICNEN